MAYQADQEAVVAAEAEAIKIKSKSREEKERRYDRRQWARQGQENLEKWRSGKYYDDPEPETVKQSKPVKVTRQEPERIEQKTIKIQKKGMNESAARYAQRQADRAMREAKESGKEATKKLAEKLKRKHEKVEKVEDEETVERVDKALKNKKYPPVVKTRSQELAEIRDKSHNKQKAIEEKKRIDKENKSAERSGRRAGMGVIDRNVDKVVAVREKVEGVQDRIDEIREKVAPGSTKAKPKTKSKATVKPVRMSAAEKRRLDQQMARSQRALAPKSRSPFSTTTQKSLKSPTVQKSVGSLNRPNTSDLNQSRSTSGGLNQPKTPSFGSSRQGNPFSTSRKGNPFSTQRHSGNPFGATSSRNPNPIGWAPKRITRL